MERIQITEFISVAIFHNVKRVDVEYFRTANIKELSIVMDKLKERPDWEELQNYQFKAEY